MADTNRAMSMKCVILGNQNARRISAAEIPTRKRVSDIGCPGFLSGLTASHSGLTTERLDKASAHLVEPNHRATLE
jgi:hypothetical protein